MIGGGRIPRPERGIVGAAVLAILLSAPASAHDPAQHGAREGVAPPVPTGDLPACDPPGPFGLPGLDLPPEQIGAWGPVQPWPVKVTHATVLHTGKVLFWREGEAGLGDPTLTYLWNPADDSLKSALTPSTEMFCSGHASLADGRILAGGGTVGSNIGWGPVDTNLFDPASETWTRVADMNYGRYYATLTTLSDGRVLAFSGTISIYYTATIPEVYDPAADAWTALYNAENEVAYYPHDLLIPDGRVLFVGPSFDTQALDVGSETWESLPFSPYNNILGSAVQYEPGKIMKHGGASGPDQAIIDDKTQVIDLAESTTWSVTSGGAYPRGWYNLVLLPDGQALAVGGATGGGWHSECAVHAAELWDPATRSWSVMASQDRPREYHSVALLLPDGRVLSAGGENSTIGGEYNYEIYSPPYLFRGPRPMVDWAPAAVGYGDAFTVDTPDAGSISRVALLRPNSVTHSFDQNQRHVPLGFSVSGADALTVAAPAQPELAPPGYYLLFLVSADGVPSVGEFVLLGDCTSNEDLESACADGADNDCDGLADHLDPQCGPLGFPLAPAGAVADGGQAAGAPLTVGKVPGDRITLSWSPSCSGGDTDYAIYEGAIGDFDSHVPLFCSTNGATTRTFGRLGSNYYLVVPHNDVREGSYGVDGQGAWHLR